MLLRYSIFQAFQQLHYACLDISGNKFEAWFQPFHVRILCFMQREIRRLFNEIKYYAQFTNSGERKATWIPGVNCETPPSDAIEITEKEQNLYATGQYIRSADGKPVEKPSYASTTEEKLAAIRSERDRLLMESDKYMLSDYPITDIKREQWKIYRQVLRHLPVTCDPDNPVWPVKPE